jgi:hypothetical protein
MPDSGGGMSTNGRGAKRRAPAGGYDFEAKEKYRRHVWSSLARHCPVPVGVASAVLMPSLEGTEIEVAKRYGFQERNLHVVDYNPAIVATLKKRFPDIRTYGVSLERAVARMVQSGIVIHAANFDFTSCAGEKLYHTLEAIRREGALHRNGVWAVTLLRGRETFFRDDVVVEWGVGALELLRRRYRGPVELNSRDATRIGCAASLGPDGHVPDRIGVYKSSNQTMMWCVFRPVRSRGRANKRTVADLELRTVVGQKNLQCLLQLKDSWLKRNGHSSGVERAPALAGHENGDWE